jgi:hypothetical protein
MNELWSNPRHRNLTARVQMLINDLFPRNVEKILTELTSIWKTQARSRRNTANLRTLRSRLRALKTETAIHRWVYNDAPLIQMSALRCALSKVLIRIYELSADDPEFDRIVLRLGRQYPLRDAGLLGIDIWEQI